MSDLTDHIDLSDEQRASLDLAMRWEDDALRALGEACLRESSARRALERAQHELAIATARAQEARAQHDDILGVVAAGLSLPPGRWKFDSTAGVLKKE